MRATGLEPAQPHWPLPPQGSVSTKFHHARVINILYHKNRILEKNRDSGGEFGKVEKIARFLEFFGEVMLLYVIIE